MFQRLTQLVMLVLASLGGAPLWLHEGLCHHQGCGTLSACTATSTTCCGSEATDCSEGVNCEVGLKTQDDASPANTADQHLSVHSDHDCWVCFQLSQSQSLNLAQDNSSVACLLSACIALGRQAILSTVECPPPARGPPQSILV